MKKAVITSFIAIAMIIPSCSCSNVIWTSEYKETSYANKYNPFTFLDKHRGYGNIYLDELDTQYGDYENTFKTIIMNVGEDGYTNIAENGTQSDKSFHFYVPTEGLFLLVNRGTDFTFYADGYVDARPLSPGKNEKEHYYYSFDSVIADELYNQVAAYIAEQKKIEEDKRQVALEVETKLQAFDMTMALNLADQAEDISFMYIGNPYHDTISCKLSLDETLVALIKNANYSTLQKNPHASDQTISNNYCVSLSGKIAVNDMWYYDLDEGLQIVTLTRSIKDKYSRYTSRTLYYSIDRETAKSIVDRAIELRSQIVK